MAIAVNPRGSRGPNVEGELHRGLPLNIWLRICLISPCWFLRESISLLKKCDRLNGCDMAVVVKINGIPFWLVGEFTTHCGTYFSWDWDVHWRYGILTQGQRDRFVFEATLVC